MYRAFKLGHKKGSRFFLSFRRGSYILLLSLLFSFQSCNNGPKTQSVTLSYLIKDNNMHYQRIAGVVLLGENPKMKVYATVTNTSDYGGVFKFYAKLSSQGNTIEFNNEQYIASGSTIEFSEEKEINPYSFETNVKVVDWGIIAPTKTIQLK